MLARFFSDQQVFRGQKWVGLVLSLGFAFVYGYLAMQQGFSADYVVQDDARHYLFWMERFRDDGAFPDDVIADYLQSIAPMGYKLLYRIASYFHLSPDWFAKVLPLLLGLVAAGYYYGLTLAIFPVPVTGLMASVMLSQHLWCNDDVVSASPRSFVYPLLTALLFYFVRRQLRLSLVCLGLLTLFYPPVAVVATTLYAADAVDWRTLRAKWYRPWAIVYRRRCRVAIAALLLTTLCIVPTYFLVHRSFGPMATMAQAHTMPEFQPSGRHSFFREGLSRYWLFLFGGHGAILKRTVFTPVTLVAVLGLWPIHYAGAYLFPGLKTIRSTVYVLPKLILVSLAWFIAAYAEAFKLHMPGRYTSHCIMLVIPILAAIVWTLLLETLCQRLNRVGAIMATGLILIPLLFYYPLLLEKFPKTLYMAGREAPIYEYLQQQPNDRLIVSLDYEADNIPIFTKRSVLIAPEYATPFHLGYYRQMRQRGTALLNHHYTADKDALNTFVNTYSIDFWLVNKAAFFPDYLAEHRYWANNYPRLTKSVVRQVNQNGVLQANVQRCSVVETERFWLATSQCLINKPDEPEA